MIFCEFDIDIAYGKREDTSKIYLDLDMIMSWYKIPGGIKVETSNQMVYNLVADYDAFTLFMKNKFPERFIK